MSRVRWLKGVTKKIIQYKLEQEGENQVAKKGCHSSC